MLKKRGAHPKRLFALDHNFPVPIVKALASSIPEAEMVPISEIDTRMALLDDWQVLLALHHHERPWDGMITTDAAMLRLMKELMVIHQTKLTLIVPSKAGHDPLVATGLLLTHLPSICASTTTSVAQIWVLSAASKDYEEPAAFFERVATKSGRDAGALMRAHELTPLEFAANPLAAAPFADSNQRTGG